VPPRTTKARAYKDSTTQQLRSFWETARRGSFTAAAAHLRLANQTVWQQVRALEKELGEPLLVRHGRNCRLTEAGQILADLTGPLVESLSTLQRRFMEARSRSQARLVVATTLRILAEDLPQCVVEFSRHHPGSALTVKEMDDERVLSAIEEGEAELGIGVLGSPGPVDRLKANPWLDAEPLYELTVLLVTARDHPLARQPIVGVRDLAQYPLLNADLVTTAILEKAGQFKGQASVVETVFATTIRRYAALGIGFGLVRSLPARAPDLNLHERDLSRQFGRLAVYHLNRKGVSLSLQALAFTNLVRDRLNQPEGKRP
jgi:DNA-binding transcriptional LysR family regulator